MAGLLCVVGLTREAEILRRARPDLAILVGGSEQGLLSANLGQAVREANGVLSFGLCGALDPALRAGDLLIATEIVLADGRVTTDAAWSNALAAALPSAKRGVIAGADTIAATAAAKHALRTATGADAVDMECHLAAAAAARAGLPFAAVRAVSDDARHGLPPAAVAAFRSDGGVDLKALLRDLARNPLQLPDLIRLGRDATAAFRALEAAAPKVIHTA